MFATTKITVSSLKILTPSENCVRYSYIIIHNRIMSNCSVILKRTYIIDIQITNEFEQDIIKLLMLYHYLLCCLNSIHVMLNIFDEPVPWYLGWRQCLTLASKKSIIDCGTSPLQEKEWWIVVIHWRANEVDQIIAWPAPIQGKYLATSINNHNKSSYEPSSA